MTLQDATHTTAAPRLSPEQQLVGKYYQHQALICQWFATLLAKELDETALKACINGEAAPLLEDLEGIPELAKPVQQLSQAISTLHLFEQPKLELVADFASLFLSDARHSPAPYASLYLDEGRFSGPSLQRMQARLAAIGMAVSAELTEPADHVSIMLDYLAESYRQLAEHPTPAAEATVANFVNEELASWLPEWANRGQKIDTASQFYPALLSLVAAYFAD